MGAELWCQTVMSTVAINSCLLWRRDPALTLNLLMLNHHGCKADSWSTKQVVAYHKLACMHRDSESLMLMWVLITMTQSTAFLFFTGQMTSHALTLTGQLMWPCAVGQPCHL